MAEQVAVAPLVKPVSRRSRGASDTPESEWGKARERLAWLLVAPSILVVAIVALYPLFQTFRLSFTNQKLASSDPWRYLGFEQYQYLLSNDGFQRAFRNTVVFTFSSVVLETLLGIVVALIINSNFRGRGLMRTSILIPWAIPTVVSARLWEYMYHGNYGVINDLLVRKLPQLVDWIPGIGGTLASIFPENNIAFTARPNYAMPAMVMVDVWKTTPFMALLILAGLQIIPGDVYEASFIDGATKIQQFFQMTLPLLKPALLVALIFRTLDAFRVFDVIYVMRGVAVETQTLAIFSQQTLVNEDRLGQTSAASVIIFLCIGAMVLIYTRLVKVEEA